MVEGRKKICFSAAVAHVPPTVLINYFIWSLSVRGGVLVSCFLSFFPLCPLHSYKIFDHLGTKNASLHQTLTFQLRVDLTKTFFGYIEIMLLIRSIDVSIFFYFNVLTLKM